MMYLYIDLVITFIFFIIVVLWVLIDEGTVTLKDLSIAIFLSIIWPFTMCLMIKEFIESDFFENTIVLKKSMFTDLIRWLKNEKPKKN